MLGCNFIARFESRSSIVVVSTWWLGRVDSARDADPVTGLENNADDGNADGVALVVAPPRSYTWIVAGGAVRGIDNFARLAAAAAGVDVGGARFTS